MLIFPVSINCSSLKKSINDSLLHLLSSLKHLTFCTYKLCQHQVKHFNPDHFNNILRPLPQNIFGKYILDFCHLCLLSSLKQKLKLCIKFNVSQSILCSIFENATMKLEGSITSECLQAQQVKYPWKIIQKLLRDNDFAMKVTIKLVITEVIDYLATILRGQRGQVLISIILGNHTNKHFRGYEILKQTPRIAMAQYCSPYSQ